MIRRRLLALLAFLATPSCFVARGQEAEVPTITVTGIEHIRVRPDRAVLSVTIESRGTQLNETAEDNEGKVVKATSFLRESGIATEGIHTEAIRIKPIYGAGSPIPKMQDPFQSKRQSEPKDSLAPTGYLVQRQLRIQVDRLERFEVVYRGLIEQGVNQVDGIRFDTSKRNALRQEARFLAIRSAKEKAELMVGELGAELEGVQTINELSAGYRRSSSPFGDVFDEPFGAESPPSGIVTGEIEIGASVEIVFRMKETELD